jgi:hypothetical protein
LEVKVKKAHLSPVTSLLVSFSLALGILVSNLSGYELLTTAHAQTGSCSGTGSGNIVVSDSVKINEGVALSGIAVRGLVVNGNVVPDGVIAGSVRIVDSTAVNLSGVIVGSGNLNLSGVIVGSGNLSTQGVIVGSGNLNAQGGSVVGSPCTELVGDGVIVGSGDLHTQGVIVGSGNLSGVIVGSGNLSGVIVGNGGLSLSGVIVGSGDIHGGTLTGDNVTVDDDGVITGTNLILTGSTIDGSSIQIGDGATVQVSPAD